LLKETREERDEAERKVKKLTEEKNELQNENNQLKKKQKTSLPLLMKTKLTQSN